MNNEPVAWMNAHTGHLCSGGFLMTKMQDYIPLYTHPAKTLTDEEIRQTAVECGAYINEDTGSLYPDDMCVGSFARAILKKASEK